MKTRIAAAASLAFLTIAAPGIVLAQDRPSRASDAEDRRLDEALRRAYGDPNYPPEPTERAPEPRAVPPGPAPSDDRDDDRIRLRLGAVAVYWAAQILDASVRSQPKSSPSDTGRLKLDGSSGSVADLGHGRGEAGRAWIDLGRWFSFQGGAHHAVFHDDSSALQSMNGLTFGGQSFPGGYRTKFEVTTADLDVAFHPVMCEWGQLDLTLGARYIASAVKFTSTGSQFAFAPQPFPVFFPGPQPGPFFGGSAPAQTASQSIETALPMIGVGGTFRPVHINELSIELYARTRIGGLAYGGDHGDDQRGGRRGGFRNQNQGPGLNGTDPRRENVAYSFEGEAGVSILFFQMVGITGGYHFEAVSLQKTDSTETKRADWRVGGPFLGLVAEF